MLATKITRGKRTTKRMTTSKPESRPAKSLAARPGDVSFRDLSRDEVEALLLRNKVGRIGFSFHDRVDIQPIHYIYERGWLYGRTSEGDKTSALKHNQWIAFEIDDVSDLFDWRSVVIHGTFWIIHPRGSPRAEELWAKASELVSRIVPGALTENDPVAFRQTLFRIAVSDIRGREAKLRVHERIEVSQLGGGQ